MQRILVSLILILSTAGGFAQVEHFPSVFEEEFSPALMKKMGVSQVEIVSKLSQHPDSMKRMYVGHAALTFTPEKFETYHFDASGRVSRLIPWWDSSHVRRPNVLQGVETTVNYPEILYTYDELDRMIEERRVVSHFNSDTTLTRWNYVEDDSGKLLQKTRTQSLTHYTLTRTYDAQGRLLTKTQQYNNDPAGTVTSTYTYPAAGTTQILVKSAYVERKLTETYNAHGQLVSRSRTDTRPNKLPHPFPTEHFAYDEAGRVVRHVIPMEPGTSFYGEWPTATMELSYGESGELVERVFYFGPWVNRFSYNYQ